MTDQQLKQKNRRELLELLLEQTKRAEELEAELAEKDSLLQMKDQLLSDRRIAIENAGSIAQASLEINNVFESAQAAAEQYLENIRACGERCDKMIEDAKRRCDEMVEHASAKVTTLRLEYERLRAEMNKMGVGEQ